MTTDNPPNPGPEAAVPTLKKLSDYTDAELLQALDDACQHITGKAYTVTALAGESIRRANERNPAA